MTPVPLELPLKPAETAALAELIFAQAEGKRMDDALRQRIAGSASQLKLSSFQPSFGSLSGDPIHPSTYYMAVDGAAGEPLLLHLAAASAPSAAHFPNPLLIGRMRAGAGREVVINAIPFGIGDRDRIRTFTEKVDRAFLPRPQGSRPAIAVGNRHPEISLPAAFDAFRAIFRKTGVNLASTVQLSATREMTTDKGLATRDGENPAEAGHTRVSIRQLYHAGLWAAIRAGWREGYTAEADHIIVGGDTADEVARSVEAAKEAIRQAAGYTKFTTDTSRLLELEADPRHPGAWPESAVNERFEQIFSADERGWMLDEFSREFPTAEKTYRLAVPDIVRLAVKFGRSLTLHEELYDTVRRYQRSFDFEPSLDEAETLTTPEELIFCLHWLKARGRRAQLVPPNLGFKRRQAYPETLEALENYSQHRMWPELAARTGAAHGGKPLDELGARVTELAAVARHFQGTLSIHSGSGKQAEVLERIGASTGGRVNYKISGELQLQLLDVLSEQAADSPWRKLFERMCDRAWEFASKNAFGTESGLAAGDARKYLGNASRGRVDGNLFLVFWLGNLAGSRDVHSPDGDTRFFKQKLDELPRDLAAEARQRNTNYIVWLAGQLRG